MEVMKFIFSSFWIWLGTLIIIGFVFSGLIRLIKNIKKQ